MSIKTLNRRRVGFRVALGLLTVLLSVPAWAALTITPITWNVIGLDSNSPATGPNAFPVAARVCAVGAPSNGPITATMSFQPGGTDGPTACAGGTSHCVDFRVGSLTTIPLTTAPLAAGSCADAYFEVEVRREAAAFTRARRYIITATDGSGSVSTPQPRELYVERLISQNRNAILDVSYSAPLTLASPFPTPPASLTSTSAGGSFGLAVGGIYDIRLDAKTATQGYEQLETFANFSNAVFRILQVRSTYSNNSSPLIDGGAAPAATDFLYANGCNWQLSPVLPNYLGCQATGKAGGTISATYRIQVLTVPGGTSSTLNTLIYDYSGSSFHYNADSGSGGRTIVIEDPLNALMTKSFSPSTVPADGVSRLSITITNPNLSQVTGYSLVDNLPGAVVVAATPSATTSGCGAGNFAPTAGATSLNFGNITPGTISGNSSCTISVNVTSPTTVGSPFVNTTNQLLVNGSGVTWDHDSNPVTPNVPLTASATLTVSNVAPPPPGVCVSGLTDTLARWDMSANTVGALGPPSYGPGPPIVDNVPGVPIARFVGFVPGGNNANVDVAGNPNANSWRVGGAGTRVWSDAAPPATPFPIGSQYFEFSLETAGYTNVTLSTRVGFQANGDWGNAGNQWGYIYSRFDGGAYSTSPVTTATGLTKTGNLANQITGIAATSGLTTTSFGLIFGGAQSNNGGLQADVLLDDIIITGCRIVDPLTVSKSFSPSVIGVGQTSTMTFIINNPNASPATVTGVAVTDVMPAGLAVNSFPTNTCGGVLGQSPAGTVNLTGGSIAANQSCQFTVNVTGVTAGLKQNASNPVSSTQTGTNTGASGIARADLRVVAPPTISKVFTNTPILAGGVSRLRFTVSNPNAGYTMANVSFADPLPSLPAQMVVATPPNALNNCGSGTWTTVAGATSVSLSGLTLGPGASCNVSVEVSAPVAGTYNNTSGAVTHVINAQTVGTNTAMASLVANAPAPRIGLQKRIGLSASGPWGEFVSLALNGNVFYQFTIENTGDLPLNRPAAGWITDPLLGGNLCNSGPTSLTVADDDDNHIYECVVGPVVANQVTLENSATASGVTGGGSPVTVTSAPNTASYTTRLPDLLIDKVRFSPTLGAVPFGQLDLSVPVDISYRITVSNQAGPAINDTLAPIVIEDTLRSGITYLSFSAADTSWSCTLVETVPLHKVECTYSNVLDSGTSTTVDLNVRVAAGTPDINNTAVGLGGGDPDCIESSQLGSDCKPFYTEATVPVTLSNVSVSVENSLLVVRFGTAAEAGTLGFRVLGAGPGERELLPISDALTVAVGSGFEPQQYEVRGLYHGQTQVWIEEVTTTGQAERYGPYAIGTESGERELMVPTDWTAISAEQERFRQAQAAAIFSRGSGPDIEAELRVSATGWVRIGHEDLLAQGIDWSGTNARQIVLSHGSDAVPMRYEGPQNFGPGSAVYFLGEETTDSLYTTTTVYRLSVSSRARSQVRPVFAGAGANPAITAAPEVMLHNPNRDYDMTSAHTDPWFARRIVRVNAPLAGANESFVVPDRSPDSQGERIEVGLWGGTNFPESPDHSVRLLLNGTEIARRQFDGLSYQLIAVDLPAGLLLNGSNVLRVDLVADTGVFADVVYLDSIKVSYLRELKATDNRLAFAADQPSSTIALPSSDRIYANDFSTNGVAACSPAMNACKTYKIAGLTSPDVKVLRARDGGVREELAGARVEPVAGGYELTFAVRQASGDRYWIEPATGAVTAAISPAAAVTDPLAGGPANYLIISHPSFIAGLEPLVAARQAEGFTVRVINVEDLYSYYNRGTVDPVAIGTAVSDAYAQLGTRYVLLVGGDTYDYFNYLGINSRSFIPTNYRPTGPVVRHSPVDSPFADVDSDGIADLAIGRFPVRTQAELSAMIAKTLAYAQAPHSGKVLRIADRTGQGGVSYRSLLSTLDGVLGAGTASTNLWLDNYPAGSTGMQMARADMVARVNSGQALVTFLGHSAPASWATESLLTAAQVNGGLFTNSSVPTVAWVLGCYGTYFTSPTYNTVGAALMVQANGGGAAAVLGSSGLTNINSDLAWMRALRPRIGTERIGDAMRTGQEILYFAAPDYTDITVGGVLLGDPALRVRQ